MINVNTNRGVTLLKLQGTVDEIATDVTVILLTIYRQLKTEEERKYFRESLQQDVGEDGLAWMNREQLQEHFKKAVHEQVDAWLASVVVDAKPDFEKTRKICFPR